MVSLKPRLDIHVNLAQISSHLINIVNGHSLSHCISLPICDGRRILNKWITTDVVSSNLDQGEVYNIM